MKSEYCTIMWSGRNCGTSKMSHHQPYQRLVFILRRWCCLYDGIGRESSHELFLENQTINSSKYCSHWAQLKAATVDYKHLELVSGKGISSLRITQDPVFLWWTGKNCYSLIGNFWFIHRIHQTLHFWKSIYFGIYKILLIEKISFLLLLFSCSVVSDSTAPWLQHTRLPCPSPSPGACSNSRCDIERWILQVGRCPICYWRRMEK